MNKKEGLFNKATQEEILAYTLSGERVPRNAADFRFRLSVYGVLIEDNKILMHKNPDIDEYCIPGGGDEIEDVRIQRVFRKFLNIVNLSNLSHEESSK